MRAGWHIVIELDHGKGVDTRGISVRESLWRRARQI
jgi:hypothetical protein